MMLQAFETNLSLLSVKASLIKLRDAACQIYIYPQYVVLSYTVPAFVILL